MKGVYGVLISIGAFSNHPSHHSCAYGIVVALPSFSPSYTAEMRLRNVVALTFVQPNLYPPIGNPSPSLPLSGEGVTNLPSLTREGSGVGFRRQMSGDRRQKKTDRWFNDLSPAATPPVTDLIPVS
jgi:hypothetical protein